MQRSLLALTRMSLAIRLYLAKTAVHRFVAFWAGIQEKHSFPLSPRLVTRH